MMKDFTEIMTISDKEKAEKSIVDGMASQSNAAYISFDPNASREASIMAYNASVSEVIPLMECDKKVIKLNDVIIMPVSVESRVTGDQEICPRTILICEDGNYGGVSWGVYKCLQRIQAFMGSLHFDEGLELEVRVVKTKKGKTVNLVML